MACATAVYKVSSSAATCACVVLLIAQWAFTQLTCMAECHLRGAHWDNKLLIHRATSMTEWIQINWTGFIFMHWKHFRSGVSNTWIAVHQLIAKSVLVNYVPLKKKKKQFESCLPLYTLDSRVTWLTCMSDRFVKPRMQNEYIENKQSSVVSKGKRRDGQGERERHYIPAANTNYFMSIKGMKNNLERRLTWLICDSALVTKLNVKILSD